MSAYPDNFDARAFNAMFWNDHEEASIAGRVARYERLARAVREVNAAARDCLAHRDGSPIHGYDLEDLILDLDDDPAVLAARAVEAEE